jgi:hypothetical protein
MARFARELGVPSWIIDRMVATPANQIAWLNADDLRDMGVTIAEKPTPAAIASTARTLIQTVPRESTSLATVTPKGNVPVSQQAWNEFIEKTIALSADQHQGHAALFRACKPDSKECVMQVEYSLTDGRKALATVVQSGNGNITRREVCVINTDEVMRDCTNWDTGAKYRDVRNIAGNWVQAVE